jgi:CubicO group peptidase (beta-lactamase class C family)
VEGFGRDLQALLSTCLVGYSMQLRQYGRTLLSQQWRWSRTPADGGVGWTADVPLHVASVSKLVTAMAMTKLLGDRGMPLDTPITDWLPEYWLKGNDTRRITFRHLLTHRSGLNFVEDPTPSSFQFMKDQIAAGTTHLGQPKYQNMNFGLCRILISTLNGSVAPGARFHVFGLDLTDAFWDITSINAYKRYVIDNIFAPAGVLAPTLDHPAADALAYTSPATGTGWDSNDLSTMCGGVGWHLSVDDLLRVMATFRRRGTIVSPAEAQKMLDNEFGLDRTDDTELGRMYAKGGYWSDGQCPTDISQNRTEQCNAFFLPRGMELVVLANSPLCSNGGFMDKVVQAIEANVHSILFILAVRVFEALKSWLRRLARARRPR